jgi:hypothetical protein
LFPFLDGHFVPLNCATFRLLVAPTYLVEEFTHMITMVFYAQLTFDQIGNALCGPQLGPVAVCHGPLSQEANKAVFLLRGQLWRSAGHRLSLQRFVTAVLECITPPKDAAGVTTHTPGNLMKGQILFKKGDYSFPTFFQRLWRAMGSHRDTSFKDVPIILHYLCGSQ